MSLSDASDGQESAVQVVLITAPDEEVAANLARSLVEERLASCVNLVPRIRSIYRWKGKVEESSECLLVAKVASRCRDRLIERVEALHPYEVPEVIALPVVAGSEAYVQWLLEVAEQ